ncbi:MAG: glucose-6-phosphate isomerase [Sulfuricurvum sp.]|jgi:glucose-6-phosphate isomerase|nr:glucose-6-phosphate isomerase [Sulfuricurvum sp.]MDP3023768.1 glucose-6-phosphate isomerase [Sulfuricurvum sp.]MDP3119100.1 glucose-6-phosphate isomerase [Sulfuricurvum sp.]
MPSFKGYYETKNLDPFTLEKAYEALKYERGTIGYYDLPSSSISLCGDVKESLLSSTVFFNTIAVVGIGGSSLGIKAIDRLLRASTPHAKKIVYFENSDPISIAYEASRIEFAKTLFVVISKSGGTVETLSIFKFLISKFKIDLHNSAQIVVVSDDGSVLSQFADYYALKRFVIPSNVGGRFSVLSAVGVIPLVLAGFNVEGVLEGAQNFAENFWARKEEHLLQKAAFYVGNAKVSPINVLFSYSDTFEEFGKWVVQIWGESLGKRNTRGERVGLTPISLIGSVDQHSFLQLIIEGPLNKTVTFMHIEHSRDELMIPKLSLPFLEKSDFVNGESFNTLINAQCQATMQSVLQSGVSIDEITWECIDEVSVGKMIMYYELLTSAAGALFEINTYDQPGVEHGKKILEGYFSNK